MLSFLTEAETLAAADEQPGRRNWSKCPVFNHVKDSQALLFKGECLTQAAVRELCTHDSQANPALASCIEELLLQQKKGLDVQAQLDAALVVSLLPTCMQNLFSTKIKIRVEHLVHPDNVQDIGYIVRDIMLLKPRNDVLFKLYQYTMPFIKHNRLNFPPMHCTSKTVLMHILQIMALSCLGLYSPQHKKPTWHMRRQLFAFFSNLQARGSTRDVYIFCQHHSYLLRLALMEHFVYFTSKHMAQEMPLLLQCTGTFYDHQRTQRLVQYITDHFRTAALQNETLDWTLVEAKAQLSVERCNRTCKSQQLHGGTKYVLVSDALDAPTFREAVRAQRVDERGLAEATCNLDMLTAASRWGLHCAVRKFPLPLFIQHEHFAHVAKVSQQANNSTVIARSLLHVCLRCNQNHPHARGDMRIQYPDSPICRHCNSSVYVCVVDTLGHLVCVYGNYYYFCLQCSRVHVWRGTGSELSKCSWSREASAARRHCAVCVRSMLLTSVNVFDKKLGVMQKIFLCSRHCPQALLLSSAYDLQSLRMLVRHIQ